MSSPVQTTAPAEEIPALERAASGTDSAPKRLQNCIVRHWSAWDDSNHCLEELLSHSNCWSNEEFWIRKTKVKRQHRLLNSVKTPVLGWWSFLRQTGLWLRHVWMNLPDLTSRKDGLVRLHRMIQNWYTVLSKGYWENMVLLLPLVSLFLYFTPFEAIFNFFSWYTGCSNCADLRAVSLNTG